MKRHAVRSSWPGLASPQEGSGPSGCTVGCSVLEPRHVGILFSRGKTEGRPPCFLGLARQDRGRHWRKTVRAEHSAINKGCIITLLQARSLTRNCGSKPARCCTRSAVFGCPSSRTSGLAGSKSATRFQRLSIVAVCAVCHHEIRALSICVSYHLTAFSRVQLAVFVDDLGIDFCGDDEREARWEQADRPPQIRDDLHGAKTCHQRQQLDASSGG